ncbi:MAG: ABC transporter ATP-binding protein [Lachnospiraceae bacterium]|nr:ABC transporter ATP-binding protein [Lachnospiraceae bacterium]
MSYVLKTTNLTKKFGRKEAVSHVNMTVEKGDIYGFIGKNGAGKTTTMKMILDLISVSEGSIELFEGEPLNLARRKIGSLIEAPGLYKNCTAYENMKRFSIISGGSEEEIQDLLKLVGLADTGKRKVKAFSLGMKQRLGIAIALIGNPEFLILDEPINGLDPAGIKEIRDLILKINQERKVTVLISSHLLDELSKITTKYGIINNGVLVEEVTAEELMKRCSKELVIRSDNPEKVCQILNEQFGIQGQTYMGMQVNSPAGMDIPGKINKALIDAGIEVFELFVKEGSFENYFIERIGK